MIFTFNCETVMVYLITMFIYGLINSILQNRLVYNSYNYSLREKLE